MTEGKGMMVCFELSRARPPVHRGAGFGRRAHRPLDGPVRRSGADRWWCCSPGERVTACREMSTRHAGGCGPGSARPSAQNITPLGDQAITALISGKRPRFPDHAIRASVARQRRPESASDQCLTGQFPAHPNREFFATFVDEARDRRASLPRCGRREILISAHSGNSIQTGIFSRLPAGSITQTAPSPRFSLRRIWRVAP